MSNKKRNVMSNGILQLDLLQQAHERAEELPLFH